MTAGARRPAWPETLLGLARSIGEGRDPEARASFWLLLNLALVQRLRQHARRRGGIDPETIQDLASQKALDLVRKHDCGHWKPEDSSAGELVNFLSTVARNALVDELRRSGRKTVDPGEDGFNADDPDRTPDAPGHSIERTEFIASLLDCTTRLKEKHRTIWLFRVLYEMPTRSIARHPEVLLNPGNVDVIVQRCRDQVRRCMRGKGHDVRDLPPGTVAELWRSFRFVTSTRPPDDGVRS